MRARQARSHPLACQGRASGVCTDLVYEVLAMIVAKLLGADDTVKVRLHEFLDEVDLLELLETGRTQDVEDGDDILVMKVTEELDLAEGAEAEHGVIEGCYALDGDLALGRDMDGGAAAAGICVSGCGTMVPRRRTIRCRTRPRRSHRGSGSWSRPQSCWQPRGRPPRPSREGGVSGQGRVRRAKVVGREERRARTVRRA